MIDESLVPVALSDDGCRVLEGLWFDPYTEMWFTRPSEGHRVVIDIDHLVPLKEAHDSGANAWERAKRIAYANDLTNLMTFDADGAELEDEGDGEPDDDAEEDGPPAVLLEVVRPKVIRRRR